MENKIAIVREAGSGFGKAIATLYAMQGARVIVSDSNATAGKETVSQIKAFGGDAIFMETDTSKRIDNKSLVDKIAKEYRGYHITCW
ncbi:MAG: SDR family NAD(P)-dependent oxidoreductase [Bacteroidia bacterium]